MNSFPDGFSIVWDKQIYRAPVLREHMRKDGIPTRLIDWTTDCPSCGVAFIVSSPLVFTGPRRRCDGCKHISVHVKTQRKVERRFDRRALKLVPDRA